MPSNPASNRMARRALWVVLGGCLLVILIALLLPPQRDEFNGASASKNRADPGASVRSSTRTPTRLIRSSDASTAPESTAEQVLAAKLVQFGRSRRELVYALARRFNIEVPDDVERFFDAVERGDWEEIDAAHNALLQPGAGLNDPRSPELHKIWRGIQETWGAAREVHTWPAQKLLDYGNAILGSLRPGMIYIGGTDPGCFIPTFLNETSHGERHITLTQNALASGPYLDYLNVLYGGRLNTLTHEDSERAFEEYKADARKRMQQGQLRPGEDVRVVDGEVKVSGQVAVMAVNEKLFQTLMQKNPDASFAMEESFPFKSVFPEASPLGPVMELRVRDEQNALTRERAAQSADYWRSSAQQLLSDPEAADSHNTRMAYAKLAASQAGLLLERGYTAEAETAFRAATDIAPTSPESVYRYVNLLVGQKRYDEAIPVVENAIRNTTDNKQYHRLLEELNRLKKN